MTFIPFKFIQLEIVFSLFGKKLGSTATISCHNFLTGKPMVQRMQRIQGSHKKIESLLGKLENAGVIVTAEMSVHRSGFRSIDAFHFWPKDTSDFKNECQAIRISAIEPAIEDLEFVLLSVNGKSFSCARK